MSTPSGPTIIDAHVTLREAQDLLIKANEDLKLAPDDPSKQAALEAAQWGSSYNGSSVPDEKESEEIKAYADMLREKAAKGRQWYTIYI